MTTPALDKTLMHADAASALTERFGPVLLVRMNRPQRMNAFDQAMHDRMSEVWQEASDPDIRSVVLTGEGRGFCAGADLMQPTPPSEAARRSLRHTFNAHGLALASLDKPVIAAVNGAAAGAGLSLACAADIRLASPAAKFVPAFVDVGLVPDAGGSFYITRLLGYARAFSWLARGEAWTAQRALEAGLVEAIHEADDLVARALELASELAAKPGAAVALTKGLLARAARASLAEQMELEAQAQVAAMAAPGRAEARAKVHATLAARNNAGGNAV